MFKYISSDFIQDADAEQDAACSFAAVLDDMAADPVCLQALRALQADAWHNFFTEVDALVEALGEVESASGAHGDAVCGAALARNSRRTATDYSERREFAKAILVAGMLNRSNPDWDPADPSTDRADFDDPVVALMQMDV